MNLVTTGEVICSRCGARNRVGSYDIHKSPICGRCAAALQEKPTILVKRAVWRSWGRWTGYAVLLVAAAGVAHVAFSNQSKAPTTCNMSQPATGRYARYDRAPLIAPLTIRTAPGSNYFVKIEELGTKRAIMTFFIAGGEAIVERVPAGLFRLKYAAGDKWCGDQQLFGPSTTVSEADKLFTFDDEHTYGVDLIRQRNGNLPVRSINLRDF